MEKQIDFLGLKILKVDSFNEAKKSQRLSQVDLVEIDEPIETGFYRPLKVSWRMRIDKKPVLEQIRSKRTRKQIRSDSNKLATKRIEIQVVVPLEESDFKEWLAFYQQKIGSKQRGRMAIDQDWLKNKQEKGREVGAVLAKEGGKIIGGNLFYETTARLVVAYGIAERISGLAGSLSLMIDYESLVYAQKKGYQEVSFGQDTNLYGFHLAPGLLFYKAKLGFRPVTTTKTKWTTTYFLKFDKFGEQVIFFGGKPEELQMIILSSKTIKPEDVYLPLGIENSQILLKEKVLTLHEGVFK